MKIIIIEASADELGQNKTLGDIFANALKSAASYSSNAFEDTEVICPSTPSKPIDEVMADEERKTDTGITYDNDRCDCDKDKNSYSYKD